MSFRRTISNRFLASMSVADLLVGLLWTCVDRHQIFASATKTLHFVQGYDNAVDSHNGRHDFNFNVCWVSVDRFIAIRFPFRYQDIMTKKRCYTAIIFVWLISLGVPFTRMLLDRDNRAELWLSFTRITFLVPLFLVSFC